jgi:hypothetical protein
VRIPTWGEIPTESGAWGEIPTEGGAWGEDPNLGRRSRQGLRSEILKS